MMKMMMIRKYMFTHDVNKVFVYLSDAHTASSVRRVERYNYSYLVVGVFSFSRMFH
jgi:hypothetical protein